MLVVVGGGPWDYTVISWGYSLFLIFPFPVLPKRSLFRQKVLNRDLLTNQVLNGSLKAWKSPYLKFLNKVPSNTDENVWVSPLHTWLKILILMFFLVCNQAVYHFGPVFMLFNFNHKRIFCFSTPKLVKQRLWSLLR